MNYAYQALSEFLALRQELGPLELLEERTGDDYGCQLYHFTTCKMHERMAEIELRQEYLVEQCAGNWAVLLKESIQFLEKYVGGWYDRFPIRSKFDEDVRAILRNAKGE